MPWDKVLLIALGGGVGLFIWNAIAWMVIQHHNSDFRKLPNAAVEDALRAAALKPGFYNLPHYDDFEKGMKDPAFDARCRAGPNALITVSPAGPCMRGSTFLLGFLLNVAEAFGAAVILTLASGSLFDLTRTLLFSAGLGGLIIGAPSFAQAIWMNFPWSHAVKSTFDGVVGFVIVGLVFHLLR